MTTDIQIEIRDRVQTLRFNRPGKKNALTQAMYRTLADALIAGDASDAVAAHVFLGAPGVFTAGNDLADFLDRSSDISQSGAQVSRFIQSLPVVAKPMIAAVDGLAIGVGTTMLFHCDLVYATENASFRTPFLDLGLVPEAASSLLAPLRMGHQRAFELLCLGEAFSAQRGYEAGFVNKIVAPGMIEAEAMAAALRLAAKPPGALAAARKLMKGDATAILAQMRKEGTVFAERLGSAEAKEAFTAFLEKRKPDFAKLRKSG